MGYIIFNKIVLVLSITSLMAFIAIISPIVSTFAQTENEITAAISRNNNNTQNSLKYSDFHSNIEQMKGHVEQALFNKEAGNNSLALAHTLHPIVEVYSLIAQPLAQANSTLNATLSTSLHELSQKVNASSEEFEQQAVEVNNLINRSMDEVVPEDVINNSTHVLTVIADLVAIAGQEYAEAVENGQITEMIEYQDGLAFITRAQSLLNESALKEGIDGDMTNEIDQINLFLSNLTASVQNKEDLESIQNTIGVIISEISAITGIPEYTLRGETEGDITSSEIITELKNQLNQTLDAYEQQNYTHAREFAVKAYLENFEKIEADIEQYDKTLLEETELLLRENLTSSIDNRVPIEQIQDNINRINANLDTAEQLITGQ